MKRLGLLVITAALTLMAVVVAAQAADVTVGHSGWNWGNPQPQGNNLRAVEFAGGRGYAAGDFGTLLRTDDGGRSWTGIPTGITADLARIRAVNQDTVLIGSGCVLRRSDDGGTTFKRLPFTSSETGCPATIASLHFPSPLTGFLLLSDGTVVQTANGGTSFSGRTAVPGTEATKPAGPAATPTDILFTTAEIGFAITKGPDGGRVFRTTDGGNTWTLESHVGNGLNGLHFPDPAVGYAVGDGNMVLKTTDGGETWEAQAVSGDVGGNDLTTIRCTTTTNCLIATASGERVLRITAGGTQITSFNPSTRKIFAVAFASANSAVGVGERGATVLSTNADSDSPSFVPVGDQPLDGSFNRLRATNILLVYAPGDNGKLVRSTDGGNHWATLQVPTSEDLLDAWFVDSTNGFALDVGGRVQRTSDAGDTWALLDIGTTAIPRAVFAPDVNTVLLFGPIGIQRSQDRGDTFEAVDVKAVRTAELTDYDRTEGTALFAYGSRALVVSTDLGANWKKVKGPVKKPRYSKVDFLSAQIGFALTTDGRVWKTRNGGRTWTDLAGVGTDNVSDISFGDAGHGFLTVAAGLNDDFVAGRVLRTSDGGRTWRPQLVNPQPFAVRGIATPSPDIAFGLGGSSDLFYTTTGGDAGDQTELTIASKVKSVKKPRVVKITGKLSPTVAGANVTVSTRDPKTNRWTAVGAPKVSSTGTFTTSFRITRTRQFVAQWRGDADHNGDGSPAIAIVKKKTPKKRR
jgi:photosystem II stability/assembly factor-like uncharacterized protein